MKFLIFKKCVFLHFLLILIYTTSLAQVNLIGEVRDKEGIPISKASVTYLHAGFGCSTDSVGKFSIKKIVGDTIQISFIGYESNSFSIKDTMSFLQIALIQGEEELSNVSVSLKKMKRVSVGYYSVLSFYNDYRGPGTENSILIPNNDHLEGFINEIKFKIANAEHSPWYLRIRLRTVDKDTELPSNGSPLLEGDIPAVLLKKVNRFSIKEKNIVFPPSGIFVTLEWLHPENVIQKTYAHPFITPSIAGIKVSERSAFFTNYYIGWATLDKK